MAYLASCPPVERLRQLLGAQAGLEPTDLVAHLDHCAACQQALERLTGADPALLDAASTAGRHAFSEEPSLRRVLDGLEEDDGLTMLIQPPAGTAWIRALLEPTQTQGALGQLAGYQVTQVLGRGAMGVVVKAFDPALKRWVAIKILAPELAGDAVARERFAREAQAAAAVRHEHIVAIHAVSSVDGLPYFVMEYLAGGSLQDSLDRRGPPPWRTSARLGVEIALGLAAAHPRGLVHRDIKPSNILLSAAGDVPGTAKIGDFGVARAIDESRLTQTGLIAGTPMYMAPEQALGEAVDHRADLFSLGSVLYTLCAGREPFSGGRPVAVLRQVCEATPRPVRELNPSVPPWLAGVIDRLHAKDAARRFASAGEVAELLRHNLDHPDQLRPLAPHGVRRRRSRRRMALVVFAGLFLMGLLGLSQALGWAHLLGPDTPCTIGDEPVPLRTVLHRHQGPVWSVAFSPDGRTLATGSDDAAVRLWDSTSGGELAVLTGHTSAVRAVAFAHSGKFLVSAGSDGVLRLWDVAKHREKAVLPHTSGGVRLLALSPDDRTAAVDSKAQGVELWDLDRLVLRQTLQGHHVSILSLAISPDGKTLATGEASGRICLWDAASGEEQASFQGDPLGVRALAFSPEGNCLAAAGTGDKDVKLWDLTARQPLATITGFEHGVQKLAFSPDGRLLATAARDGVVKILHMPSGTVVATFGAHHGIVWALAFTPYGRTLATGGEDRLAKLWDVSGLYQNSP